MAMNERIGSTYVEVIQMATNLVVNGGRHQIAVITSKSTSESLVVFGTLCLESEGLRLVPP